MPIGLMLGALIAANLWGLWTRRTAFTCRWEGSPTLVMVAAATSGFLCSPEASHLLGPALHRLTELWHFEDFIGHMLGIVTACAGIYMALIRLGDVDTVQQIYSQWVIRPLTAAVPVLAGLFVTSGGGDRVHGALANMEPNPLLATYWLVLGATITYLWCMALKVFAALRKLDGNDTVLNMYIGSIMLTISYMLMLALHAVTPFDLTVPANVVGVAAGAGWAVTPTYSWARRSQLWDRRRRRAAERSRARGLSESEGV